MAFGGNWYSSVMTMTVFGISGRLSLGWNTCVLIRFKPPICSVYRALANGVLHGSLVVAYTNLAQENHQFYQRKRIFLNFGSLVRSEDTNIFENFLWFFDCLPLGKFGFQLLFFSFKPTMHLIHALTHTHAHTFLLQLLLDFRINVTTISGP